MLGWIALIGGIIVSIALGVGTRGITGILIAIVGIVVFFLAWLFLLATRELLYLLIQVEENTRNTAERISIAEESSQD